MRDTLRTAYRNCTLAIGPCEAPRVDIMGLECGGDRPLTSGPAELPFRHTDQAPQSQA